MLDSALATHGGANGNLLELRLGHERLSGTGEASNGGILEFLRGELYPSTWPYCLLNRCRCRTAGGLGGPAIGQEDLGSPARIRRMASRRSGLARTVEALSTSRIVSMTSYPR